MQMQPLESRRVSVIRSVHPEAGPVLNIYLVYSIFKQFLLLLYLLFLISSNFYYRRMQAVSIYKEMKWVLGKDISSSVHQVISVLH